MSSSFFPARLARGVSASDTLPFETPAIRPPQTRRSQILEVDAILDSITAASGSGSQRRRMELLETIFARATEAEQQFLTRLLAGELRQGALEGIMVEAVAKASGLASERVRRAAMMAGDIARVARAALEQGEAGLTQYDVQLFRPIQPMLAQSADDVPRGAGFHRRGRARIQNGRRTRAGPQIRRRRHRVLAQLEGCNAAVPEIVEVSARASSERSDPGWRSDQPAPRWPAAALPDHHAALRTQTGYRAHAAGTAHDALLVRSALSQRRRRFSTNLRPAASPRFPNSRVEHLIPHIVTGDPEAAGEFLEQALERGHEGIMAKAIDAKYAAGARGQSWVKVKRARTLDLVILAAEWGSGRRKGWLSNLHLGARDTQKGGFAMLGKTFKGLTDEMLAWQTQELLRLEIGRDSYTVHVEPKLVAEIAFNEIQVSPRYVSGLALRFARVKRYRTDKTAAEADTFETVQRLAGGMHARD